MYKKVIFDIGANKGQNLAYYLSKADKVIAVEANPMLANQIVQQFAAFIDDDKLVVESKCICLSNHQNEVTFYKNRIDDGLSSFLKPKLNLQQYDIIQVNSVSFNELVKIYGNPFYVKMDVEGLDADIMRQVLKRTELPTFISFENCGSTIINEIIQDGRFLAYNIVAGYNLEKVYPAFKSHDSGPFGTDIKSPWLDAKGLFEIMSKLKHTWVDIHCTTVSTPIGLPDMSYYQVPFDFFGVIKNMVPQGIKDKLKSMFKHD